MIKAERRSRLATIVVVMGVSGSGKTTVAAMLAGQLHWAFADGDDFHSPQNVAKMHSGIALDDTDRLPWLQAIATQIDRWREERCNGVIVCSALKRRYRDIIVGDRPNVRLVYLQGDRTLVAHRLTARHGHFMPKSLLQSQFDALEEPAPEEQAIIFPIAETPTSLVSKIIAALGVTT
ncbi:MAG: gluconokinase [Nitrococcus sp.]|nr:gluconokinase [Nitrococcus sp.]